MSSFPDFVPYLRGKTLTSQAWTTTGNTMTVTDPDVHSNSLIAIMHTAVPAGRWSIATAEGSFTITSSDVEAATTTTFVYLAL